MRILPVLDLKAGQVVHGIAGRRAEYRPIVSRLTASADPRDVAVAFVTQLGLKELYVADLDAIAGAPPALATFAALRALGCALWVDAGLRTAAQAEPSNSCKQCRDQQQACAKNYSAKTCKAEYDMCLKSCKK